MSNNGLKPYGDTPQDGAVQLSFTLPAAYSEETLAAARSLVLEMGFAEVRSAYGAGLGEDFSFFIVYAKTNKAVDLTKIKVVKPSVRMMSKGEIEEYTLTHFGRPLVLLGACIESDAHTVGIDAIMNMKGYNGHKGLEAYHAFKAENLGSQVSAEELVVKARQKRADAILVSQVVTQKNAHISNLTRLADLLEAENMRESIVLVAGGPRISHQLAKELGYDAGFGPGTYAEDVAAFVVQELQRRMEAKLWMP